MPQADANARSIHHLRNPGATLYKTTTVRHLGRVEAKPNAAPIADNAVVEAFGADKCPKLVQLLKEDDESTLLHALRCVAGVLKMPTDVVNSSRDEQHVLEPLGNLVFHNNAEIRRTAAIALRVFASHAVGRTELVRYRTMRKILKAFGRNDNELMEPLFDTALHVSSTMAGVREMSQHGYPAVVLEKLKRDTSDSIRVRALKLLKAFVNDGIPSTVLSIVELGGVDIAAKFISSKHKDVRTAALQTTGAMLYLEQGRESAMLTGVAKKLCGVLQDRDSTVSVAAAGALMVLAVHDSAKREIYELGAHTGFLALLHRPEYGVQLNTLKLVTVLAAHPLARDAMRTKQMEKTMRDMTEDANELLARSAKLALRAVLWTP
ncbi:hypothetical protein SPRG_05882 [Saprolegnia parasitica CBS 223.65]|uniref:Condensin complex subunit 1 C-terminal domain-containing protein n=1 Tax=Saprolegnia parasitica (strain CBS 223.65) TaxID=695850 RepID=A0A067CS46_SAPPC|nr:hypothetical protein SPRG_05882 [Saprolegnia parasitica CBS 223.65]KDO29346.1 hypothetical protein SPRG_05882 [Saprolegnia parasitica CBS 223.65]|eukprot:XP_012199849.1 hypothetical protein SPRG_05882 [Saprolegnia parasitica CBS 223.65]